MTQTHAPRQRTQPKPEAAPEPVTVEIKTPATPEPTLSAQTLAEQAAGREALANRAK